LKLFSETKSDDGLFKSWMNDVRMKQLIVEYIRKHESELRNDGKLENKKVVSSILSAGVNFTESEVDSLLKLFKEGLAILQPAAGIPSLLVKSADFCPARMTSCGHVD